MNRSARIICLGIAVLAAGLYLVTAGGVRASAAGKKDLTVTGCLQKGDEANEFSITGEDGKSYDLTSSSVELSKHVGHKVTVTGTFKAESYAKEKSEKEANEKKEAPEAGDIRVTSLKMVSDSCK
jgi:hypothetical protein